MVDAKAFEMDEYEWSPARDADYRNARQAAPAMPSEP